MPISPGTLPSNKPAASAAVALCLLLAACGGDDGNVGAGAAEGTDTGQVSALPAPEGAIGSVTGMPANPGPGTTPTIRGADAPSGDPSIAMGEGTAIDPGAPVDGVFVPGEVTPVPAPPGPPTPQSPTEPGAAFVQPAEGAPRPPAGTRAATESTTFVVDPAEPED